MGLPTLIMLSGTLCDGRMFRRQKAALRAVADMRVIDYQKLRSTQNWIANLLASLPERFSILGFSLGGLVALELLRRAPQRVERMAMVASNARGASAQGRRKNAWLWKLWRERGPGEVARHVKPAYFHHDRCRRRHASLVHDMAMHTPGKAAFAEFSWAALRPDGHDMLSRFQGPLLIVSGAKDRLCPPSWQRDMVHAQPAAHWLELPRVGHFVPLEAPTRLNDALLRWMRTAAP